MSVIEKVIDKNKKPEKYGALVGNRYDYQYACVFYVLLTHYTECEDFYIILEYLDDFVIVDNEGKNNEKIIYVQVKTKEGKPISGTDEEFKKYIKILADHFDGENDEYISTVLLTNNGVKFKEYLADSEDSFAFLDSSNILKARDLDKFKSDIKETFRKENKTFDEKNFRKIYLKKSPLQISSNKSKKSLTYESQLIGLLHSYFKNNNYNDFSYLALDTIYTKIWNEICTKSTCSNDNTDKVDKEY